MNDPASLQNLNDIVLPGPVAWWPPAPGWYVLAALLLVAFVVWAVQRWRRWRGDRYRRQALHELEMIRSGAAALRELPGLLKRTAIAAWPREQVAVLSGDSWHRFLDESAAMSRFGDGAGELLDVLAYSEADQALTAEQAAFLVDAAEYWLKQHRVAAAKRPDRDSNAQAVAMDSGATGSR